MRRAVKITAIGNSFEIHIFGVLGDNHNIRCHSKTDALTIVLRLIMTVLH